MEAPATKAPEFTQVATRIEQDLLALLDEKCHAADRPRAAGIRLAIRAWVEDDDQATPSATPTQVGAN